MRITNLGVVGHDDNVNRRAKSDGMAIDPRDDRLSSAASGADDRVPGAGVFQMPERVGLPVSSSRLRKSSLRPGDRGVKVKARARRVHCSSAELSHGISIGGASTEISVLRQGEGKRWLEAR